MPRLAAFSTPLALCASGVVWGIWHLPLILWGDYATSERPWVSAAMFMVMVSIAGIFFAWLRLASGSVWPAVIAHSSHNIFFQGVFGSYFDGDREHLWAGEQGLLSIAGYAAVVLWLWRSGRLSAAALQRPVPDRSGVESLSARA